MTAVSTHVDEKGYGYKIETPTSLPALFAVSQHWESGSKHKSRMLKWQHTSSLLVLTRDYDSEGRIYIDGAGKPRLEWALGRKDEKSMLHGIENSIKILLAEGATEVYTNQKNMDSFFRNPSKSLQETFDSTEFKDFIAKVHKEGIKSCIEKCMVYSLSNQNHYCLCRVEATSIHLIFRPSNGFLPHACRSQARCSGFSWEITWNEPVVCL